MELRGFDSTATAFVMLTTGGRNLCHWDAKMLPPSGRQHDILLCAVVVLGNRPFRKRRSSFHETEGMAYARV